MSGLKSFWEVKIQFKILDEETGKVKKKVEKKLIEALSFEEAAPKIHKIYQGFPQDWEIIGQSRSSIDEVIE